MTPGERVNLIKKLADHLSNLDWDDMDLIFRQFRLYSLEDNPGPQNARMYAVSHLEHGDDGKLIELHDYLFPSAPAMNDHDPLAEGRWQRGYFRLFLSHTSHHKAEMAQLKKVLERLGIDAFVAHEDIEPTKEWISEIDTALGTCQALAAFLTPEFHGSKYTDQEIGYCLRRRVLIIPIRYGVDPYGFIARYQGMSAAGKIPEQIALDIFNVLIEHRLTEAGMAQPLVNYFTSSYSYDETRRRWPLVQRIRTWTPELLAQLNKSATSNPDIRDCSYNWTPLLPQIEKFIAEHT